jgi:alpha-glucoside transport system substrate-binding protein
MAVRRRRVTAALLVASALAFAACSGDDGGSGGSSGGDRPFAGTTVTVLSPIRDVEAERLETAWASFEERTGIDIRHEPSAEFDSELAARVEGGTPPDIAIVRQPGLLATLARAGTVVALDELKAAVEDDNAAGWVELGSVDGTFYAPPLGATIKSLVWYSPETFSAKGYAVPETWDELVALTEKIAADGGTPWCAGAESGVSTGWPITDWLEDVVLRFQGADYYDRWVAHEIPFNDAGVAAALDTVGGILKNDNYVQGGTKSIATTPFQEAGRGILDGTCYLHRQASFYGNQFAEATKGPDGQVNAFLLPVAKAGDPRPVLGEGDLITVLADRPEVREVARFLTSADYANERLKAGNWLTPNKRADVSVVTDPLERTFAEILTTADVFRFDGSALMPAEVGTGTFWKGMTDWILGADTKTVLDDIETSWPR